MFVKIKRFYNKKVLVNTFYKKYDILMGSKNATTSLRYHTNTRKFLFVLGDSVSIKLTPWKKNRKNLKDGFI